MSDDDHENGTPPDGNSGQVSVEPVGALALDALSAADIDELRITSPELADILTPQHVSRAIVRDTEPAPSGPDDTAEPLPAVVVAPARAKVELPTIPAPGPPKAMIADLAEADLVEEPEDAAPAVAPPAGEVSDQSPTIPAPAFLEVPRAQEQEPAATAKPAPEPVQPKARKADHDSGKRRAQIWAVLSLVLLVIGVSLGILITEYPDSLEERGIVFGRRPPPVQVQEVIVSTNDPSPVSDEGPVKGDNAEAEGTERASIAHDGKRTKSGHEKSREEHAAPETVELAPLTVAQIRETVSHYSASLRQCNERERLRTNAAVDSRVVLYLKITPSGRVGRATVQEGSASPTLKACVENAAKRWRFPRSSEPAEIQTPFHLKAR